MKLKILSMTAAAVAMIAGGALAQDTTAEPDATPMADDMVIANDTDIAAPLYTNIEEMTVGNMLNMIAYDPNGERIGDIDYVVQGLDGAEVVVGIGGFLGLGEYTVALPLEEFELNADGTGFVLDTTRERLEQLPEFDEANAESLPDDVVIATLVEDTPTEAPMTEEPVADEPMGEEDPVTDETVAQ